MNTVKTRGLGPERSFNICVLFPKKKYSKLQITSHHKKPQETQSQAGLATVVQIQSFFRRIGIWPERIVLQCNNITDKICTEFAGQRSLARHRAKNYLCLTCDIGSQGLSKAKATQKWG